MLHRRRGDRHGALECTLGAMAAAGAGRVVLEVLTANDAALALFSRTASISRPRPSGGAVVPAPGGPPADVGPTGSGGRPRAGGLVARGVGLRRWRRGRCSPSRSCTCRPTLWMSGPVAFGEAARPPDVALSLRRRPPAQRRRGAGQALMRGLPAPRLGNPQSLMPEDWRAVRLPSWRRWAVSYPVRRLRCSVGLRWVFSRPVVWRCLERA